MWHTQNTLMSVFWKEQMLCTQCPMQMLHNHLLLQDQRGILFNLVLFETWALANDIIMMRLIHQALSFFCFLGIYLRNTALNEAAKKSWNAGNFARFQSCMIDLFFLTIVMTIELSNLNNVISEKKADKSPVTIIRSQWYAELCLMLLRWLSSSSYGAVADSKQKQMNSTNKRIHL